MTNSEFIPIAKKLFAFFKKEANEIQLSVWFDRFKFCTSQQFEKTINDCIDSSKYFPTISEFKILLNQNKEKHFFTTTEATKKYCCFNGCQNAGTMSHSISGSEKWICGEHWS